jgi:hypothetical protein
MRVLSRMPDLAVLSLLATFFFGALSIYFYRRARRFKRLSFMWSSVKIQARVHPDVRITFRDVEVQELSRLVVLFWNSGTAAVRAEDLLPSHPVLVSLPKQCRILSTALTLTSSETNSCALTNASTCSTAIAFTYLNPGDGAEFEMLYDSTEPKRSVSPAFRAPIIGGRPPTSTRRSHQAPQSEPLSVGVAWSAMSILGLVSVGTLWPLLFNYGSFNVKIFMLVCAITFSLQAGYWLYWTLRNVRRRLGPPPFVRSRSDAM